jgi:transcriptional regulator with XRE-family HTH domain
MPKNPRKGKKEYQPTKEKIVSHINKKWFTDKLADHKISQRRLAEMMHLDPAAMNRTFKGSRKMQLDEAANIAKFMGVSIEEVLANAGIDTRGVSNKDGRVLVKGWVDEDFNVHTEGVKGMRFVASLPHEAPGLEAFRLQTASTHADALDGNIVFYRPTDTVAPNTAGRWCVVKRLDGRIQVRVLKPGYRRGTYNLIVPLSSQTEEDVVLDSAAPVVRMEF